MAEPAKPSHLEPSQAENRLMTKTGSARAHEPGELGSARNELAENGNRCEYTDCKSASVCVASAFKLASSVSGSERLRPRLSGGIATHWCTRVSPPPLALLASLAPLPLAHTASPFPMPSLLSPALHPLLLRHHLPTDLPAVCALSARHLSALHIPSLLAPLPPPSP